MRFPLYKVTAPFKNVYREYQGDQCAIVGYIGDVWWRRSMFLTFKFILKKMKQIIFFKTECIHLQSKRDLY